MADVVAVDVVVKFRSCDLILAATNVDVTVDVVETFLCGELSETILQSLIVATDVVATVTLGEISEAIKFM